MKIQVFYSGDYSNLSNLLIMSAEGSDKAHAGLVFTLNENDLSELKGKLPDDLNGLWPDHLGRLYFESICKKDKRTGKNGVRGPYDFRNVVKWYEESFKSRRLYLQNLPFSDKEAMDIFIQLLSDVNHIHYAKLQIIQNWLMLRFKKGTHWKNRSKFRWHCAETCVRKFPAWFRDLMGIGDITYDEIVPGGKRGPSLYNLTEEAKSKMEYLSGES